MTLVKILARKDAYSLITGVTIALALHSLLMNYGYSLSAKVADNTGMEMGYSTNQSFANQYVVPLVSFLVQIVLLEIIAWAVYYLTPKKSKK